MDIEEVIVAVALGVTGFAVGKGVYWLVGRVVARSKCVVQVEAEGQGIVIEEGSPRSNI